jgi:hypothetical protein
MHPAILARDELFKHPNVIRVSITQMATVNGGTRVSLLVVLKDKTKLTGVPACFRGYPVDVM